MFMHDSLYGEVGGGWKDDANYMQLLDMDQEEQSKGEMPKKIEKWNN